LLISDKSNCLSYKCSEFKIYGGRSSKVQFDFRKNVIFLAKSVGTIWTKNV